VAVVRPELKLHQNIASKIKILQVIFDSTCVSITTGIMTTASRRIEKELKSIENDRELGFSITLVNGDLMHWKTTVTGPPETPYAGGVFGIEGKSGCDNYGVFFNLYC